MHTLIHINEALAGLPVNVRFVNFEDVKNGALEGWNSPGDYLLPDVKEG